MKILFTLLFLLPTLSFAQHNFRSVDWLMSKANVIAAEKRKPTEAKGDVMIFTNVTVGSYQADLLYTFKNIGLTEGAYLMRVTHSDHSQYYEDYLRLKRTLTAKYGEPDDREIWYNDLYKTEEKSYGLAASAGHVTFLSKWTKDATVVNLVLSGDNFKPSLGIVYKYRFAPEDTEKVDTKDF